MSLRPHCKGGAFLTGDSAGETPTEAVETTALPQKVAHDWGGNILAIPAIPGAFDGIDPRKSLQTRGEAVGFWPPGQRMWNYPR